jgi:microcin C transport system permease protein
MLGYLMRRLLLIIPTLLAILLVNFFIVQAAPGGPVEQAIAKLQGVAGGTIGAGHTETMNAGQSRASRGLDPKLIKEIEHQYGFDKPLHERLWLMLKNYARLDFGNSFFRGAKVTDLILQKMPVSISLGLWATLITYLVSIPLGIRKAVKHGSHFDIWSSTAIIIGYAMPAFLFAMLLVVAGIPQAFISVFFAGSLMIEVIFSLDGLGRMSYEAAVSRDYPVVFGSLFIFTLFGLLIKLVGDICYTLVDPRIDFSARNA